MRPMIFSILAAALIVQAVGAGQTRSVAPTKVVFSDYIAPLLDANCRFCHGGEWPAEDAAGFDLASYDSLMAGGADGRVIVPGNANASRLIARIEGRQEPRMPLNGDPLPDEIIRLFRRWIDEGAQPDDRARREYELSLPGVQLPQSISYDDAVIVSCRTPAIDPHLRVTITDDETGAVLFSDWRDVKPGEWVSWDVSQRKRNPPAKTVTVTLFVSPQRAEISFPNPSGTVFVLGKRAQVDAAKKAFPKESFDPNPAHPPGDQSGTFHFALTANADVDLGVWRSPDPKAVLPQRAVKQRTAVMTQSMRDLSAGAHEARWNLRTSDQQFVSEGWYTARFVCKPRDRTRPQPDFAILFKIGSI
jgi:hypothetical protein